MLVGEERGSAVGGPTHLPWGSNEPPTEAPVPFPKSPQPAAPTSSTRRATGRPELGDPGWGTHSPLCPMAAPSSWGTRAPHGAGAFATEMLGWGGRGDPTAGPTPRVAPVGAA